MKTSKIVLALFIVQTLCLLIPQMLFAQTETLDIIQYTPPKGWAKTLKDGAMVYTDMNKATGGFCLLTVYASSPSAGDADKDFTSEWNNLVVKPFKAQLRPKTESQTNAEGWKGTVGGAEIEMNGLKAVAMLTVYSGFGKAASVLVIFNDPSYAAQIDKIIEGIKLDKKTAAASNPPTQTTPGPPLSNSDYLNFDPFPDKPYVQPQKPLIARLRKSITLADLAGKWTIGGGPTIMEYATSSTQSQTSVSLTREWLVVHADGTYEANSQSRASNTTIRESERGTIILSGAFVTRRDSKGRETRNQFVAFMELPNGSAVLSLLHNNEGPPMDGKGLSGNCHHGNGYVTCNGGEEWVRIP